MASKKASDSKNQGAALRKGLGRSATAHAVIDAFQNSVTGVGTARSKVSAGEYVAAPLLTCEQLEILFADNDLASVIVSKIVEDALRDGFGIEKEGGTADEDKTFAKKLHDRYKELQAPYFVQRGGVMARLFGGGGLILGVKGAGALSTPLQDEATKGVEFLQDFDRQDMQESTYYRDGSVETYLWTKPQSGRSSQTKQVAVHESRIILFPGAQTTNRKRIQNQGWDLSVLQRVYAVLLSFDGMFSSTDAMFADASQAVFKLQGLIAALAENDGTGDSDIRTRLSLMDMGRSSGKAVVLDAGDENGNGAEEFSTVDRATLGTLDGVIGQYYVRLAAAARMPLTVLLGMSPAGMDATGESDMILYYNTVDIYRKQVLEPRILRILRLLARAEGDSDPSEWVVSWPELARPKPLDVKTAEKMAIDSCVALITSQVALPEEVALSLTKIAPSLGLMLDRAAREKALKEALTEVENREMTGPVPEEPEPVVGPKGVSQPTKSSERKTPSKAAGKQI